MSIPVDRVEARSQINNVGNFNTLSKRDGIGDIATPTEDCKYPGEDAFDSFSDSLSRGFDDASEAPKKLLADIPGYKDNVAGYFNNLFKDDDIVETTGIAPSECNKGSSTISKLTDSFLSLQQSDLDTLGGSLDARSLLSIELMKDLSINCNLSPLTLDLDGLLDLMALLTIGAFLCIGLPAPVKGVLALLGVSAASPLMKGFSGFIGIGNEVGISSDSGTHTKSLYNTENSITNVASDGNQSAVISGNNNVVVQNNTTVNNYTVINNNGGSGAGTGKDYNTGPNALGTSRDSGEKQSSGLSNSVSSNNGGDDVRKDGMGNTVTDDKVNSRQNNTTIGGSGTSSNGSISGGSVSGSSGSSDGSSTLNGPSKDGQLANDLSSNPNKNAKQSQGNFNTAGSGGGNSTMGSGSSGSTTGSDRTSINKRNKSIADSNQRLNVIGEIAEINTSSKPYMFSTGAGNVALTAIGKATLSKEEDPATKLAMITGLLSTVDPTWNTSTPIKDENGVVVNDGTGITDLSNTRGNEALLRISDAKLRGSVPTLDSINGSITTNIDDSLAILLINKNKGVSSNSIKPFVKSENMKTMQCRLG